MTSFHWYAVRLKPRFERSVAFYTDLQRIVEAGCPVQTWPYTSQGATMIIEKGPLRGVKCILETTSGTPRFIFSIHILHRSLALKVDHLAGFPYTRPRSKAS